MSKELTEKWRNGTLEGGMYYVKIPDGDVEQANTYQLKQLALVYDADKIEVIEPVPSYEELQKLKERLADAEKTIKFYADIDGMTEEEKQMSAEKYHLVYGLKANDYLEKWGVK